VTLALVIISALATYLTQRAVIANQTTPPEGQAAMIQRLMLVGIPVSVLVSGFLFPLGVLLYWFTSNLWTLGQQYYIFRYHPHTPATEPAAAAGPPGKALAPKVGQKPVSPKGSRPGAAPRSGATAQGADPAASRANGVAAAPNVNLSTSEPAAGQPADKAAGATASGSNGARGARPAGNRPGNKRSPSKKRR
jgi:YidC/Oxa1 family membrane protein insertase